MVPVNQEPKKQQHCDDEDEDEATIDRFILDDIIEETERD